MILLDPVQFPAWWLGLINALNNCIFLFKQQNK